MSTSGCHNPPATIGGRQQTFHVVEDATAGTGTVNAQQTAVIPHTIPITPPSVLSLDARLTRMEGMLMDLLASSAAGDDRTAAGSQHALPLPSVIAAAPVAGETHLRPHQHDAARLPDGYSIVSRTRRPKANLGKSWGGVATISNTARVPSKLREDLSGPDFMAHQIGNIVIYNVYLLPKTKSWVGDLESDPCLAVASSLAVAYAATCHILIMGDLNARTGSQTPSVHDPVRYSLDEKPPSTGKFYSNYARITT
ncbi:hypothetical protein B0H13DRAFT_2393505 [Mycena leptocephala]|nr:hypothetical protein B0H13DRAFT_2393505 [Mycena leptocephala]